MACLRKTFNRVFYWSSCERLRSTAPTELPKLWRHTAAMTSNYSKSEFNYSSAFDRDLSHDTKQNSDNWKICLLTTSLQLFNLLFNPPAVVRCIFVKTFASDVMISKFKIFCSSSSICIKKMVIYAKYS